MFCKDYSLFNSAVKRSKLLFRRQPMPKKLHPVFHKINRKMSIDVHKYWNEVQHRAH